MMITNIWNYFPIPIRIGIIGVKYIKLQPPFLKNDPEIILIELSGVAHNFSVFESSHLSFDSKSVIVILINSLATFAVLDIKCPNFSLYVENVFISHSRVGENTCYETFGEITMKTKSHG